ncbi:MAG: acetylxylan esterase [Rubrobacter sp.]|nr:acetylxylan esterase [Rubrobacter sp.]
MTRLPDGHAEGYSGGPQPPLTRPPDFEPFWEKTRVELAGVEPAVSREPLESQSAALGFEGLAFDSLGEARVSGYAIRWKDDVPRPLVVHSHGYGGGLDPMWCWAEAGVNVVGVEARGYGRSGEALPVPSRWGYVLTGIESPEEYVLRGAVCDYMRAVEVGAEILGPLVSRTVLNGTSFAGGLAVMAQSVMQVADLLVVAVPTFGWAEGRRSLVEEGSGREINRYLEAHPGREEDVMALLSYFDPMNFATDIRCPTLVGLGLQDDVVPAPTVYAIANHLGCPHEVVRLPVSHTERPEEKLWDRFEARWLRLAVEGVPPGFGEKRESSI